MKQFVKLCFDNMLQEIGINKEEYVKALRVTVKVSFQFLPKRECRYGVINNYNLQLLKDDPSNHDIQIITGEEGSFDVASYVAKHILKGQSKLLKGIEDESAKQGESTNMKFKELAKLLEDTRGVSRQEIIFPIFGYLMCLSLRKCKFIQT